MPVALWIATMSKWSSMALLGAIWFLFNMEVALRYFFSSPTTWSSDVIGFLLLALVFSAVPWLTKENAHITVAILPENLNQAQHKVWAFIMNIVMLAVLVAVSFIVVDAMQIQFLRGNLTSGVVQVPRWALVAIAACGFIAAGFVLVAQLIFPTSTPEDEERQL